MLRVTILHVLFRMVMIFGRAFTSIALPILFLQSTHLLFVFPHPHPRVVYLSERHPSRVDTPFSFSLGYFDLNSPPHPSECGSADEKVGAK
ncbi:MAG: hypothetical protein JOS17DRAFT_763339 [Linnemannia elongata]|nr:MAG: hypothetical protein JOS17DRAFT_763339 [Linnemannia elongata]